jgi:ribose 5-phosphate isomerase A
LSWVEEAKKRAAQAAIRHVKSETVIGLGTGSTAEYMIQMLSSLLDSGTLSDVQGVPTSNRTLSLANSLGIPITTLDEYPKLDLSIDGADLIDNKLNVLKGGGGALFREKIVASASQTYIIIADERKVVKNLGIGFPLPIEVLPFSVTPVTQKISELGANVIIRIAHTNEPMVTDNGNYIVDADFGPIDNPEKLEIKLKSIPGVIETGIFLDFVDVAYIGTKDGLRKLPK